MLHFIETICFEHGVFNRVSLHEDRMNRSRYQLLGCRDQLSLSAYLAIPETLKNQKVKCRVTYSIDIENIEFEIYEEKRIKSLKIVRDNSIDYGYKFKNRESLERLREQRGNADEILIVKNGQITDTSFANIAFLQKGVWFTPEFPLLKGTRREDYLLENKLFTRIVRPEDLYQYEEARLINSMRSLEDAEPIGISGIYP